MDSLKVMSLYALLRYLISFISSNILAPIDVVLSSFGPLAHLRNEIAHVNEVLQTALFIVSADKLSDDISNGLYSNSLEAVMKIIMSEKIDTSCKPMIGFTSNDYIPEDEKHKHPHERKGFQLNYTYLDWSTILSGLNTDEIPELKNAINIFLVILNYDLNLTSKICVRYNIRNNTNIIMPLKNIKLEKKWLNLITIKDHNHRFTKNLYMSPKKMMYFLSVKK